VPAARAGLLPYLVLLRVGFAMPAALLPQRCALTAPFHPYRDLTTEAVCFLWHFPSTGLEPSFPDVIRHTALRSSDFPPLRPGRATGAAVRSGCQRFDYSPRRQASGGRLQAQASGGRLQAAGGRRQAAGFRRQAAGFRRQATSGPKVWRFLSARLAGKMARSNLSGRIQRRCEQRLYDFSSLYLVKRA
jgi:hypothetical protein